MTRADGRKRTDALFFNTVINICGKMDKKAFEKEMGAMAWALIALWFVLMLS